MMDCFLKFLSVLIQLKGQYIFVWEIAWVGVNKI
jgi:hypothetical protein